MRVTAFALLVLLVVPQIGEKVMRPLCMIFTMTPHLVAWAIPFIYPTGDLTQKISTCKVVPVILDAGLKTFGSRSVIACGT